MGGGGAAAAPPRLSRQGLHMPWGTQGWQVPVIGGC